jgi:hypothetical protein
MIDQATTGDNIGGHHSPTATPVLAGDAPPAAPGAGLSPGSVGGNYRIAVHEASHSVATRALGDPVAGVTIIPNGTLKGRMWGPGFSDLNLDDAPFYEKIRDYIPQTGESKIDAAPMYGRVHTACTQLVAGEQGELLFFPGEETLFAVSDIWEALGYASLVASSFEAVELFLAFIKHETFALLQKHKTAVRMIAEALIEHGTLNGEEVDDLIVQAEAEDALAVERSRRLEWRATEMRAAEFRTLIAS